MRKRLAISLVFATVAAGRRTSPQPEEQFVRDAGGRINNMSHQDQIISDLFRELKDLRKEKESLEKLVDDIADVLDRANVPDEGEGLLERIKSFLNS